MRQGNIQFTHIWCERCRDQAAMSSLPAANAAAGVPVRWLEGRLWHRRCIHKASQGR